MKSKNDLSLRLDGIEETLFAEFGHLRKILRQEVRTIKAMEPSTPCKFPEPSKDAEVKPVLKPQPMKPNAKISKAVKLKRGARLWAYLKKLDHRHWFLGVLSILGLSAVLIIAMLWQIDQRIQERIPTREHIELMKRGKECVHGQH